MVKQISIIDFFERSKQDLVLDARSEGEFLQGHIPHAISFPILNDEERVLVGTCYKKKGHQAAVLLGYELVGPNFKNIIQRAYGQFPLGKIYVHCWRGGLRSKIMGDLLSSAGYQVHLLKGGYKAYRKVLLEKLAQNIDFKVLGGFTGCNKTGILQELNKQGIQFLDLETLANHRGSAFGNIGLAVQNTQEQFENDIFEVLLSFDLNKAVWVEDESRLIGKFQIPQKIYDSIRNNKLYFLDYSFEKRCENILNLYGKFPASELIKSTLKIKKKLGDLKTREAIAFIENGNLKEWIKIVLKYYDKLYEFGVGRRAPETIEKVNYNDDELINYLKSLI